MNEAAQDWQTTRWSLLARLTNWDDQQSWREFFDAYGRLIYSVARKAGLSEAEAQDVVQDTLLSVAKKIGAFRCDPAAGSFKAIRSAHQSAPATRRRNPAYTRMCCSTFGERPIELKRGANT